MKKVWDDLLGLKDARDGCNSVKEWLLNRLTEQAGTKTTKVLRWLTTLTACWNIWKGRCSKAFDGKQLNPKVVIDNVRKSIQEKIILQYNHRILQNRNQMHI